MGGKTKGARTAFNDNITGLELARGDLGRVAHFVRAHASSNQHVQGPDRLVAAVAEVRICFAGLLAEGGSPVAIEATSVSVVEVAELILEDFHAAHRHAIMSTEGIDPHPGSKRP